MVSAVTAGALIFLVTSISARDLHRDVRDVLSSADRESFFLNLFEVLLSTIDAKLRRVENMDRALEHVMRRVEAMDKRVVENMVKTDAVMSKLRAIDTKLFHVGKPPADTLDTQIDTLSKRITNINDQLSSLRTQLDTNSIAAGEELTGAASERRHIRVDISKSALDVQQKILTGIDTLKNGINSVEHKMNDHMGLFNAHMNNMITSVSEIHSALTEEGHSHVKSGSSSRVEVVVPPLHNGTSRISRIESLFNRMNPLMSVCKKMDEMWNVVVGTKSSVDNLVPKSEELLTKTQRQERAISNIHTDLNEKTNKIIENLGSVEKRLMEQKKEIDKSIQGQKSYGAPYIPSDLLFDVPVEFDSSRLEALSTIGSIGIAPPEDEAAILSGPGSFQSPHPNLGHLRGTTRSPSIVFPSVKNKPIILNSNLTIESVHNQNGIKGYSCADFLRKGMTQSGVYYLQIRGTTYWYLKVRCDMNIEYNRGGWTVIQRREDFGEPREEFNRNWEAYKHGFGDPAREFWLGNENIFMLTNSDEYVLRIELEDFDGNKRWAEYSIFRLYSEKDNYKLEIGGYDGNAGDSLNDPWYGSNLSPFSTYDRDNDRSSLNCASMLKGGWWWRSCGRGLNGLYLTNPNDLTARQGIVWFRWKGWDYTLKKAAMMIRPKTLNPRKGQQSEEQES